jgi:TrmH family RNA methyltransferase
MAVMKRVILVEPEGPWNVGAVVRAAVNFGPVEVDLVGDAAILKAPEFQRAAHGVPDPESRVRPVSSLREAVADCHHSIGFTARGRDHRQVEDWRKLRTELHRQGSISRPDHRLALVFGNEANGLANEACDQLQRLAWIAASPEHRSLNLAVATAVVLHDLFEEKVGPRSASGPRTATHEQRQRLQQNVQKTLTAFAEYPSYSKDIEAAVQRLFSAANLETRDVRAWHAILGQLEAERGRRA